MKKQTKEEMESPAEEPKTPFPPWATVKLKPAVSLAIVAHAIAAFILFFYLKLIGWPELLQASITSEKGLALILIFLAITVVAVAIIFYSASYCLFMASSLFSNPKDMPASHWVQVLCIHVAWLIFLGLTLWGSMIDADPGNAWWQRALRWCADHLSLLMGVFLALGVALSVITYRVKHRYRRRTKQELAVHALFGFLVAFSSVLSTLIVWMAIKLQGSGLPQNTPWQAVYLTFALTLPSIFIGMVQLSIYKSTGNINKALSSAGLIAMVILVSLFSLLPRYTAFPITMMALRSVGVYSTEPATFQLLDAKQRDVYQRLGFKYKGEPLQTGSEVYFEGYVRYRFADVLLLCTSSFDPLQGDLEEELKKKRKGCILTEKGEVRRVQWAGE